MTGNFRLPISSSLISPDYYVRPIDWLNIDSLVSTGNQKFVGLYAIFNNDSNFVSLSATTAYTVNWGDGVVENYSSGVQAYHQFNYSDFAGTESFRGYRQSIITITPNGGNLTNVNISLKHNKAGLPNYIPGWLDIKMSGSNITSMNICSFTIFQKLLESFNFIGSNAITSWTYAFLNCSSLKRIVVYTGLCTNMGYFFNGCTSLVNRPTLDFSSVTSVEGIYIGVGSMSGIIEINKPAITNYASAFQGMGNITKCIVVDASSCTNLFTSIFSSCTSLVEVEIGGADNITSFSSCFNACPNLSKVTINIIPVSINFASCKLSKTAITDILNVLKKNTAQTITITGNWGADTAVSKTTCGTVAGSAVVTQSNTSSLAVGMLVLGTGISTAIAVSFQDSGDTVTLNAHGLVDGKIVSFPSVVTTTGIAINTPYFVVNSTTNTFQVSLTLGGSAIALTANGTGTVAYGSYIQSIITNTSFTLDKPASSTGTVTLTSRILDTSIATMKGWTVTG